MNNIAVIGAHGKMGTVTCQTIEQAPHLTLVSQVGRQHTLSETLDNQQIDIAIEFSNADAVFENSKLLLNHGIKTIIGASGLDNQQVKALSELAEQQQTGCIIAPNFSIGAILMMKFAAIAAKHFPEVEIIEAHHQQKLDAPSGTAVKTAQMISQARQQAKNLLECKELHQGARGAEVDNVNIHAVRLPGYIASQQVLFGSLGENLTIEHNSISRDCFMPGVLLAIEKIQNINHLIYGLENLI